MKSAHDFQTVFGRNLVGELKSFVHRPFLLVIMQDMWPKFESLLEGAECRRVLRHRQDGLLPRAPTHSDLPASALRALPVLWPDWRS